MADYDSHATDYDLWAADMVEDVQWYVSLARDADEPIVMLAVARERAAELPVELREGDIRDLELDEPVDLIICPFRSLLHLRTWAEKRQLFERVAAALRPGGRFAWNVFAFSPFVAVEVEGKRETRGDTWQEVRNIPADNRIDLVRNEGVIPLWWMTRAEQEGLCDAAGLEVEALYGGFHREPYDETTLEMVWVARKP